MRIAVVDDDRELTRYLVAALPDDGFTVEAFGNGAAVKTALARNTYDAVIIDWNMPGCRNLAATLCETPWMLFFDIDNVASEASLLKIRGAEITQWINELAVVALGAGGAGSAIAHALVMAGVFLVTRLGRAPAKST